MQTHLIVLHEAPADAGREHLLTHWRDVRSPWAARQPGVLRYVQDAVLANSDGGHRFFGVEEFWVDDTSRARELLAILSDPAVHDDTGQAMSVHTQFFPLLTTDNVVLAGTPITRDEVLPKRMTFLRRKSGLVRDDMLHYWRHLHGPLAASVPGVRRYVQSPVTAPDSSGLSPPIEGVAQIWIDDEPALRAIVASPLFRKQVKPDEANFVDTDLTFTLSVREQRVVWPGQSETGTIQPP